MPAINHQLGDDTSGTEFGLCRLNRCAEKSSFALVRRTRVPSVTVELPVKSVHATFVNPKIGKELSVCQGLAQPFVTVSDPFIKVSQNLLPSDNKTQ